MRKKAPETTAEKAFVDAVREDGSASRKMNGIGHRHWPDQLVLKKRVRRPLWVEFKREDEEPNKAQDFIFEWLRSLGQEVVVATSYEEAWSAYRKHR